MASGSRQDYWETRLRERFGLHGVGHITLGRNYNHWLYRVRRVVFKRTIQNCDIANNPDVLDVGSGTGFYIQLWKEAGAKAITGIDLTSIAVENLRQQFSDASFLQMDIGADISSLADHQYDVISVFDVLFHITDDEAYRQALINIYQLLKPGGVFIFSDNFLHHKATRMSHHVSRELTEIKTLLSITGFEILSREPMFVLMLTPVDSLSPVRWFFWRVLARMIRMSEWLGWLFGAVLYPIEVALIKVTKEGPSTEIMVCRKPATSDL